MIVYKLYRAGEEKAVAQSCFLPTVQEKVLELLSSEFRSVMLSENCKTVSVVDHKGILNRILIVTPTGDSDTIMYMDYETADEIYRIEKDKLK